MFVCAEEFREAGVYNGSIDRQFRDLNCWEAAARAQFVDTESQLTSAGLSGFADQACVDCVRRTPAIPHSPCAAIGACRFLFRTGFVSNGRARLPISG